jgi:hypothetical protein
MNEKYIKITGSEQVYKLIEQTTLANRKVQMVLEDSTGTRFVFTRQSGCYKVVDKPKSLEYDY